MNKADLVDAMSKLSGLPKAESEKHLDAFIEVVTRNIAKDDGIKLVGFGSFSVSVRKARLGRNPQTGAEIQIPERKVPVFKAGKELRAAAKN